MFSVQDIARHVPKKLPRRGALWEFKDSTKTLLERKDADKYVFAAQYQQKPGQLTGGMFGDGWHYYDMLPADIYTIKIYGDTAQKIKEKNDFTVFQCWGKSLNKRIYLIDQIRGKWEAPDLEIALVDFWNKHKPTYQRPVGASQVLIEDKSSGTGLIQSIRKNHADIPIDGIPRHIDKFTRALSIQNYIKSGAAVLPSEAEWLSDYKDEFRKFTPLMTHKHDDQIDATIDAITDLIINDTLDYNGAI